MNEYPHSCELFPLPYEEEPYDPFLLVSNKQADAYQQELENQPLVEIISKILAREHFVNESFEGSVCSGYSSLRSSPSNGQKYPVEAGFNPLLLVKHQQHLMDLPFQPLQNHRFPQELYLPEWGRLDNALDRPARYFGSGRFTRQPIISALL